MALALFLQIPGALAVDEELAKELRSLRLQQRQLERDAREYRMSLEALGDGDGAVTINENALVALRNQLERAELRLALLERRKQELEVELGIADQDDQADQDTPATAPQDTDPDPLLVDPDPSLYMPAPTAGAETVEVAASDDEAIEADEAPSMTVDETSRLSALLSGYYANPAGEPEMPEPEPEEEPPMLDPNKVQLNGEEGLLAIDTIAERLARGSHSPRLEQDVAFYLVVRRDGRFVGSSSHNLKSVGKAQYVGRISIPGGEAVITVRRTDWILELPGEQAADYLVTLNMPDFGDANLHVIPVDELVEVGIDDPPPWLPYLGSAADDES